LFIFAFMRLQSKPREDTYVHKALRKQLIEGLRQRNIKDEQVLAAIEAVPRHFFLEPALDRQAYEDRAFPIGAMQTISQPYTVAFQTELLQIKKFDKVLEVGTGSAFQACVLAELGAFVHTIERQRELHDYVGHFFLLNKYPNIRRHFGDGYAGLLSFAPFNKVIVTAAAPFVPPALVAQLKPGGIMVIPVGESGQQRMLRIQKDALGNITEEDTGAFSFVPMLPGKNV
jgi:protein-L-isoaspartate(D-aspartate) O-methyltransferase